MRLSFAILILVVTYVAHPTLAEAIPAVPYLFSFNLSLGDSGSAVASLQARLNIDPDTRVADAGPGSPGNETTYFGPLTRAAVIRFQEKYKNEVLTPVGLIRGNGYVGHYTRMKLNETSSIPKISVEVPDPQPIVDPPTTTPTLTPTFVPVQEKPSSIPKSAPNPNLAGLEAYFAALDTVGAQQGLSTSEIAALKELARAKVEATTTDLTAAFIKQAQDDAPENPDLSPFNSVLASPITRLIQKIFSPTHALAATGAPFGGQILFAFPCDGGIWNITYRPLPPFYPVLLSYLFGSQLFLSYNIPLVTTWNLGFYEPIPAPYCIVGTIPYPSQGFVTPFVGSSAL